MRIPKILLLAAPVVALAVLAAPTALAIAPVLPIAAVTPGSLNTAVTQSDINSTICVRGYTSTIRPPAAYTTSLKKTQLRTTYARYNDLRTSHFEEDHLISLELGGSPTDAANLWPEPYATSFGARTKDQVENKLHSLVCSHTITLATAQKAIASNWYAAWLKYMR